MAYVTISVIAATFSLVAFRQLLGKCTQPILLHLSMYPRARIRHETRVRAPVDNRAPFYRHTFQAAGIIRP